MKTQNWRIQNDVLLLFEIQLGLEHILRTYYDPNYAWNIMRLIHLQEEPGFIAKESHFLNYEWRTNGLLRKTDLLIRERQTYDSSRMSKTCLFTKNEPMVHWERTKVGHWRIMNLWLIAKEKHLLIGEKQTYSSLRKSKICSFTKDKLK